MAASRWQTVPVVIWRTGAPLRASRAASFSVARSPTSAATRWYGPSCVSVCSSNVVFPAPGLDTRLTTNTPASRKRCRSARATEVVLLEEVLPDFDQTGVVILRAPGRPVPAPCRCSTCGVGVPHTAQQNACTLLELPLGPRSRAVDDDGHLLDHQPRSLERRLRRTPSRRTTAAPPARRPTAPRAADGRAHTRPPSRLASSQAMSTMLIAIDSSCMRSQRAASAA